MKNTTKIFSLFLFSSLLQLTTISAVEPDDKVYVTPRTVRVMKKKILIQTEKGTFKTQNLFSDAAGVYAKKEELKEVQKPRPTMPGRKFRERPHKGFRKHWKKCDRLGDVPQK